MTRLGMTFDPNQHSPHTAGSGQLPVSGKDGHIVILTGAEVIPTKDRSGTMLVFEITIKGGEHDGVTGPYRLNIGNNSADAVRIAFAQLSAICHVVGHLQPLDDVSVLFNKPFRAFVSLQTEKEAAAKGFTEIKHVMDIHGNKPGERKQAANAPVPGGFPAPGGAPAGFPPPPQAPPQQMAPPQQPQYQPQAPQQPPEPQYQPPQPQAPQQMAPPQQPQYQQAPPQYQPQAPQGQPNPASAPWAQR